MMLLVIDVTRPLFILGAVTVLLCLMILVRNARRRRSRDALFTRASRALDAASLVRGPLRAITHVRGSIDGVAVVISRRGVELDGDRRKLLLGGGPASDVLSRDTEQLKADLREAIRLHRAGSLVRGASASATCPYCKDAIAPREREGVIRCAACESLHHTPCWQEHGGCSVHGCARVPSADAPSRLRAD